MRRLQRLLLTSRAAKLLAVRRVTQDNRGKKAAGVDGVKNLPASERPALAESLSLHGAASPVRRLGVVYVPNGMAMPYWTPKTSAADFEYTPILQPLEPFKDQMLVLTGLHGVPGGGAHAGRSTSFLTGVTSADGGASSKTG